jgi:hypothetical protein
MPRGPAPAWRARMPVTVNGIPVATAQEVDAYIIASVNQAGGKHHPQTGHYATLFIRDFATREEATAWRQALFRCAHFLARRRIADVSMKASPPRRKGNGWEIEFCAVNKTLARKFVMETYGPDRSKWPYDPRRRGRD